MERDSSSSKEQKTYCHSCGKYILTSNFLIHEGRCQRNSELRSSRVSENSDHQHSQSQKKQKQHAEQIFARQQNNQSSKYSYPSMSKKEYMGKVNGSTKKTNSYLNNQPQQKIPCPFCGYMQSLFELDTHPNECQHRQVQCGYCQAKFPKSLMDDHRQICQKNPRNIQRSRRNQMRRNSDRGIGSQDIEDDMSMPMFAQQRNRNMYSPSPLMNMFNDPVFNQMMGRNNRNRQQHQHMQQHSFGPGVNFIQFSSNNGNPFIIRSNSSNPSTFIQLIQMLARRANPNQNPGLNQQELSRLAKIKYNKKNEEPDLCTICYCQFEQNQEIVELKCKHLFHQQCIFEWLKRVSTCPVCKNKLKQGPVNSQEEDEEFQDLDEPHNYENQNHHQHQRNDPRHGNDPRQGNGGGFMSNFFRF